MPNEKNVSEVSTKLRDLIFRLGVDKIGIASLDDWKDTKLEETALKLLPTTHSVVVLVVEVYPEIMEHASLGKRIDGTKMRELVESHQDFLNNRLTQAAYDIARASHGMGLKALPLLSRGLPFDRKMLTAVFSYKGAAQAAGLGHIGKHSLLMTPDFGPRVRLACCLVEAVLTPTSAGKFHKCGKCRACINNCPAGALDDPQDNETYSINKFACFTYRQERFCLECMRLCPAGKRKA